MILWCQTVGVISPILLCLYMDGLLNALSKSNVGCHIGGVFAGQCGDDLKLLTPSVHAIRILTNICEMYATFCGPCENNSLGFGTLCYFLLFIYVF